MFSQNYNHHVLQLQDHRVFFKNYCMLINCIFVYSYSASWSSVSTETGLFTWTVQQALGIHCLTDGLGVTRQAHVNVKEM